MGHLSLFHFFFYILIPQYIGIAELVTPPEEIWFRADRFACQCFCMTTDFTVDESRVAHAKTPVEFGYGVDAIPLRDNTDLNYWMKVFQKRQLIRYNSPNNTPRLRDFSVAIVTKAPAKMSRRDRELTLNKLSGGQYHIVKEQYEANRDSTLRDQLKQIQKVHGISLKGRSKPKIYTHLDRKRYRSLADKADAWREQCHNICTGVVGQEPRTFHFKPHKEFAFLKGREEPFNEGNWFSAEPIHEGEMGVGLAISEHELGLTQEKGRWADRIKKIFAPLFHGMRTRKHSE